MQYTKWPLNLQLFDGDAGDAGTAAAGGDHEAQPADAGQAKHGRKSDLSHLQYGKRAEPDTGSPEDNGNGSEAVSYTHLDVYKRQKQLKG